MCAPHTHTNTVSIPEAHAEAQEATRAGDVGDPAHLFCLSKPLAVRLLSSSLKYANIEDSANLDKYVDDCKVALGVVVDLRLDRECQRFVVQPLP